MKKENRLLKTFFIINTVLLIISFSIAFIILFRPFYYYHIKSLNLEKETGYNYNEIKEAYDDVLDYLTLNKKFSTGKLKYSNVGMDHFKDCKKLFIIDFIVLGITSVIAIIKKKYFNNLKVLHFNLSFWSSSIIMSIFIIIVSITFIIGFNKFFKVFHNIFFLGKDNWILDPDKDEIINILPKSFFMNCGILLVSVISIISTTIIIKEIILRKKTLKKDINY